MPTALKVNDPLEGTLFYRLFTTYELSRITSLAKLRKALTADFREFDELEFEGVPSDEESSVGFELDWTTAATSQYRVDVRVVRKRAPQPSLDDLGQPVAAKKRQRPTVRLAMPAEYPPSWEKTLFCMNSDMDDGIVLGASRRSKSAEADSPHTPQLEDVEMWEEERYVLTMDVERKALERRYLRPEKDAFAFHASRVSALSGTGPSGRVRYDSILWLEPYALPPKHERRERMSSFGSVRSADEDDDAAQASSSSQQRARTVVEVESITTLTTSSGSNASAKSRSATRNKQRLRRADSSASNGSTNSKSGRVKLEEKKRFYLRVVVREGNSVLLGLESFYALATVLQGLTMRCPQLRRSARILEASLTTFTWGNAPGSAFKLMPDFDAAPRIVVALSTPGDKLGVRLCQGARGVVVKSPCEASDNPKNLRAGDVLVRVGDVAVHVHSDGGARLTWRRAAEMIKLANRPLELEFLRLPL